MQSVFHCLAVVAVVAVFALLASCSGDTPRASADLVPAVEAVQARSGTLPLQERVSGIVRAENQVAIRAEIDAPIVEVLVRSGEAVRQGQALVRLDDRQLREQLRQAEANVRLAEGSAAESGARLRELQSQLERTRRLAGEQLVSTAALEALEAQVAGARASAEQAAARIEQARAALREQRSELGRAVVRAPVSGRVGQRNAEVGMQARADTILFQIGDLDELIIEVPLTQKMLAHLREGNRAVVRSPALGGTPIEAKLSRISPFLHAGSFSTTGEVDVSNRENRLTPGMFVTVDILYGQSTTSTLVPASAIWEDPKSGAIGIYVVGGMTASTSSTAIPEEARSVTLRPVEVTAQGGGVAGVTGVKAGEWTVIAGQHLLAEQKTPSARVRAMTWERIVRLQGLQREDLLHDFLAKQQRVARSDGAEPPDSAEYLAGSASGGSR